VSLSRMRLVTAWRVLGRGTGQPWIVPSQTSTSSRESIKWSLWNVGLFHVQNAYLFSFVKNPIMQAHTGKSVNRRYWPPGIKSKSVSHHSMQNWSGRDKNTGKWACGKTAVRPDGQRKLSSKHKRRHYECAWHSQSIETVAKSIRTIQCIL
jgi:hypothetical protein